MIEHTAEDYSKYINIDLDSKLLPINETLDEMLMRLEEFESMMALVQQERCNAIGLTGALTESMDMQKQLNELCSRIDTLEKLVSYLRGNVEALEKKIEVAEEHVGLIDNTNKIKNFFMPLFKKNLDPKPSSFDVETTESVSINKYFTPAETDEDNTN